MSYSEMKANMYNKKKIIDWIVENNINTTNTVGKIIAEYYKNDESIIERIESGVKPEEILGQFFKELSKGG